MCVHIKIHVVTCTKTTNIIRFSNQNKNKANLVLNPSHETKQTKTKTRHVWNKNPTRFYYNEYKKIEQGYDKKCT